MAAFGSIGFGTPNMDFSNPQASYNSAYQNAASINQQLYGQFQTQANSIQNQYAALNRNVMRRMAGSNRANMMDIANKYTAMSGQVSQQMIDRGLGNTTLQFQAQRGVAQDRAHETTRSRNMYAQLMGNMQAQIGQAGLQSQQGLLNSMLQYVSAPYPDPSVYAQMAAAGGGGHGFQTGPPGMPGMSAPQAPTGGHIPQSLFSPSYTVEGGGGGGAVDPSFYGMAGGGYAQPQAANRYSYLPGYEMGASGIGPYVPPGSYPQVEASYG
jgi:hypothetical protein